MFSFIFFAGCQSTDKKESYLDTTYFSNIECEYDATKDETEIIWNAKFTNNTIYNFESFEITFKLYNDGELIDTKSCNYDFELNHGKEYIGKFRFFYNGEIDSVKYVSWIANYSSFWDTYKIWIIVTLIISLIASIIYIIIMIVQDLELYETYDYVCDNLWTLLILLLPFCGSIYGVIESSWVSSLVVLAGLCITILIALFAHFIKYLIQEVDWGVGRGYNYYQYTNNSKNNKDKSFNNISEIKDCVNDYDKLQQFTVEELRDYCRNEGIKGFSNLNKNQLIDLIMLSNIDNVNKSKKTDKGNAHHKVITFNDIIGLDEAKNAFREKVVLAFKHKDLYDKYNKKAGGGILLYGLPGTGKTMFAEAASNESDSLFIPIKCSDIKSKWYGESESNVQKIFDKARKAKRAIIFFDEFEAIGAKRTDNVDNGNNDLVPQILAEMQGINSTNQDSIILVIAATNKPWAIDSAFLRPGRFDEKIYIPLPDLIAREHIFKLKLDGIPQENLDYNYLAEITEGINTTDIVEYSDKK